MPIMEISLVPLGTASASVGEYVAEALKSLKKRKGINYRLTSMGTIVEAPSLKQLLDIAGIMHKAVLAKGAKRVVTSIKIDDRKDKRLTSSGKIKSVERKLKS